MSDAICDRCGDDKLTDYPVCPACATRWHFPHRAVCLHCEHKREAEKAARTFGLMLRLVAQLQHADRQFADEPILRADFKDDRMADFRERMAA